MSGEVASIRPNPYIFDIENRKKRKPRLAHDLGAGAKCNKCGDKCPGFELHFWRKICMNCRCGKDDHEVEDDEEDIGQIVIGKLFDRPPRTEREEMEYCYGNSLEMLNEETGRAEKVKFDWVPPNVEKTLASRYMELLPPNKRPVAGSEAAKARRRQLEQQVPLYDMDAAQRSDSLPPEELQNFLAYLERIRSQVVGQGTVQEIAGAPTPSFSQPLQWQSTTPGVSAGVGPDGGVGVRGGVGVGGGNLDANGNIGFYPDAHPELGTTGQQMVDQRTIGHGMIDQGMTSQGLIDQGISDQGMIDQGMTGQGMIDQANLRNNNVGMDGTAQTIISNDALSPTQSRRGSSQVPSLRQQFLGGMVGEPAGIPGIKREEPAFSSPYGGTRMTASPFHGLRNDKGVEGISTGLSDLSVQNKENVPGLPPSQVSSFTQSEPNRNDTTQVPYSSAPKGYRPVKPGHLRQQGTQADLPGEAGNQSRQPGFTPSGIPGYQPRKPGVQGGQPANASCQADQSEFQPDIPGSPQKPLGKSGYLPGYQSNETGPQQQSSYSPGKPSYQPEQMGYYPKQPEQPGNEPGQPGYQPGQPGYLSGQPGYQPGQPGYQPGQPGYQPGQPGYQPGQPGYQPGQPGYQPGQPGYQPGQPGYQPGQPGYQQGQPGYQPGQPGYLDNQDASQPGHTLGYPDQALHPSSDFPLDDQEFPPPPPPELLAFGDQQPGSDAASIDSGIETYDNIGAKLRARIDEDGKRTPLQQMLAKERNIAAVEAMQAPYGVQREMLAGGMSIAPGSDVTVLFPGESQMLGTPTKNRNASGSRSKYTCQGCSLPMNKGDVAIFCERAGEDKCWHPACFSCYTCKELLADLIYFYKDGKVFCGRHFTESEEMPRCKACDELIFGNSWTRADGFDWHINHFCCNVCDTPMAGQRYVPDQNGYPYCLPCYMSYVAKMCESCEEKISPEVNRCGHRGYFYHATPQCFRCHTCLESLLGKRFKMSKNWVFCSNECIQRAAEELASNTNPKTKEEV